MTENITLEDSIFEALSDKMVKDSAPENLRKVCFKMIYNITQYMGYPIPATDNLNTIAGMMCEEMYRSFPRITLQEIIIVFRMASHGEFGEVKGINMRNIYAWFKGYHTHSARLKANSRLRNTNQPASVEPSEEEKDKIFRDYVQEYYRRFLDGKELFLFFADSIYKAMERYNLLNVSEQEKCEVLRKFARIPKNHPLDMSKIKVDAIWESKLYFVKRYFKDMKERGCTEIPL